jgi:hypothetical protein
MPHSPLAGAGRLAALVTLTILLAPPPCVRADLLTFGYTHYAQTPDDRSLPLEGTLNVAVFRRGHDAPPGDPWGTGHAVLAGAVRPGLGSPAGGLDLAAQYLYVYQLVNDGADGQTVGSLGLTVRGATSWGALAGLGFFDADGAAGAGNPLGAGGSAFDNAFRAGAGGDVRVGEDPGAIAGVTVDVGEGAVGPDLDAFRAVWHSGRSVRADQRSELFYFTSGAAPAAALFSAQGATAVNAPTLGTLNRQGSGPGLPEPGEDQGGGPVRAAPEPSTLVLLCLAAPALAALVRRRSGEAADPA